MARKKAEPASTQPAPELAPDVTENQQLMAAVVGSYSDERDLVNQLLGQSQMAGAFEEFSRTVRTSKLAYVKENKLYRALAGGKSPHGAEFSGSWEEFCTLLGRSVDQVDRDIQNLRAFGEEALESMSRMGIGYRELRQYRRLPEDSQTALIEVAKSGDKDALLELAEDLIAKQSAEKAKLTKERDDANADAEQARTQSAERDEKIRALEKKVDTAQRKWRQATPDDQAETLREQVTLAAQAVLNALAPESEDAGLMGALLALSRHADEHGMDVRAYMGGVIAELTDALDRIRAHDYIQAPVMAPAREG